MLTFSTNPDVAEQQMNAIIFYLTAFGYIDGEFDVTEKTFVRIYIRQLVTARAKAAMPDADPKVREEIVNKFVGHFHEVFEQIDRGVRDLFDEPVADGEDVEKSAPHSDLGARIVMPLIATLQDEVMEKLDAISIEDLCSRAREAGVDCGGGAAADFTI
mgnify:CR=1 FL=1